LHAIHEFEGTTRDEELWRWIAVEGRLGRIKAHHATLGDAALGMAKWDCRDSVLDWIRKRVFVTIEPEDLFDRSLEWFFDIRDCLFIRQLCAVLAEGQNGIPGVSSFPWERFALLLEPYWKSDCIGGKAITRCSLDGCFGIDSATPFSMDRMAIRLL
jgi:hypothetical protein